MSSSGTTIKLAANLSFLFKEYPVQERLGAASRAGFKAVEFGPDVLDACSIEELVAAQSEAKVEVVGLCTQKGSVAGDKGLTAIPGREQEFKDVLKTAIEYANALKCPRVHTLAGTVDTSHPNAGTMAEETYISNLKYAADQCAESGITVLIEAISTIPHYFLRHQQQAVDILRKVDKANVKIEFDTFHAQTLGGNMAVFLQSNFKDIGHVQIGQVPGRRTPDENGEINFPFLFKTLLLLGYDQWIGCEYIPSGRTEETLKWAEKYLN